MRVFAAVRLFVALALVASACTPCHAYHMAADVLCEMGVKYYQSGQTDLALQNFKKALLANPDNTVALQYIALITSEPLVVFDDRRYEEAPLVRYQEQETGRTFVRAASAQTGAVSLPGAISPASEPYGIEVPVIDLVDSLKDRTAPIELEKDTRLIVRGTRIQRFLSTQPDILHAKQHTVNEILISGLDFGTSYLHVWDDHGRWTLSFLVAPPKYSGQTFAETMRSLEERARNFKLRYAVDWSTFESGRRINDLDRQYYSYTHALFLTGDTPHGALDASITAQTYDGESRLSSGTIGLENGVWGQCKGFSLRAFDFTPRVTNLAFPGAALRGGHFYSPAAQNKLDYSIFWGKELSTGVLGISSKSSQTMDSYVSGASLNYYPFKRQHLSLSAYKAGGLDRSDDLKENGYDASIRSGFGPWNTFAEAAYDSQVFAHIVGATYTSERIRFSEELRESAREFVSMTGTGWRAGEVGSVTALTYKATDKLVLDGRLDVFQDRLYPSLAHPDRWNQDLSCQAQWYPDSKTQMSFDYGLQNATGRISELRTHSAGASWNRSIPEFQRASVYALYRYQDNTYFTAPALDYRTDKFLAGFRFNVIDELYYFFSQELDLTKAKVSGDRARPHVYETGFDWYRQIGQSPFWGNVRVAFRDEEDADSAFSFLAGEDYLEAYAEMRYRSGLDLEAYVSGRFRNVWRENPLANKRMELSLNAGLRYLWDTGFRWEPVGMVEGFVFHDYNCDGIKQADEPCVEGITVWLGKQRTRTTNKDGYYLFPQVQARKATVYLDTASVPQHFVLTTPASQEVAVAQSGITEVNFGITSRTEITGVIFEDIDGDNVYSAKDLPLRGIGVELEDGSKASTDGQGRYVFNKTPKGAHTIRLDLRTVPPDYIPTVSIFKDVELQEGASLVWHFPLKKVLQ